MSYSSRLGDEINAAYSFHDPAGRLNLVRLRERLALHHEPSYRHCLRVGEMARQFARFVGASETAAENLALLVSCHDIGKLLVPASLLDKPKPTPEEQEVLSRHGREGAVLLEGLKGRMISMAAAVVTLHHKRFKIQQQMLGAEVPPALRITSLCDSFDSAVFKRPYRKTVTPAYALEGLVLRNDGKRPSYDPAALAFFIHFGVISLRDMLTDADVDGLLSALRRNVRGRGRGLVRAQPKPAFPRP